jgi:hypothetical protein
LAKDGFSYLRFISLVPQISSTSSPVRASRQSTYQDNGAVGVRTDVTAWSVTADLAKAGFSYFRFIVASPAALPQRIQTYHDYACHAPRQLGVAI